MTDQWKALRGLYQDTQAELDPGQSQDEAEMLTGRSAISARSELATALPRLEALDRWLESQGLPADWTGPLDAWGWALRDGCGVTGYYAGVRLPCSGDLRNVWGDRWDQATPAQRIAALAIRDGVKV